MKKLILFVIAASVTMLAIGCAKPEEGDPAAPKDSTPKQTEEE